MYNTISDIRFKTTTLKSNLCNYSDVYIFAKGKITIAVADGAAKQSDERNKGVIFRNCVPFITCKNEIVQK